DVFRLYERELHRMNAMDFDDLLFRAVNLLELFPEVRERYATTFRHVLVDEYQDTNHAQYRWLQLLVGGGREAPARGERTQIPGHRNLAVVGDDSQSIYSFRGADIRNILEFAEARFVVGEIERLVDEGVSRSEIAVFYRTNAMSRVIEDALVRREIAYQVIGGTKFYERAEIKDAVAYLSLLANPFDVVSFTRIANSPRRGIGQTSLSRVIAHATAQGVSVWQAAAVPEQVPGLGAAATKALRRFMAT